MIEKASSASTARGKRVREWSDPVLAGGFRMDRIQELEQIVVDQIAAGEVIERPASVVKELVENSIDAEASKISVHLEEGGRKSIVVSDNGLGIHPDDIGLAFKRHATSKIRSFEDLLSTRSMGFRGEALSSIASVSHVHLKSRMSGQALGREIRLSPGQPEKISDWTGPSGTFVEVRDLFQNLPVRLKFMKSVPTEQSQVVDTLSFIALGHPRIQFHLFLNGRPVLALPSRQDRRLRLMDLYPSLSEQDLANIILEGDGIRIEAEILSPGKNRKDRKFQNVFLNNRWIRHPGLLQAITQGASGYVHKDVHPGAWVWIEIFPDKVDVNVHPTKKEVRFMESDRIFSLVRRAVQDGLKAFLVEGADSHEVFGRTLKAIDIVTDQGRNPPSLASGIFSVREETDSLLRDVRHAENIREDNRNLSSLRPGPPAGSHEPDTPPPICKPARTAHGAHDKSFRDLPEVLKSLPPAPFSWRSSTLPDLPVQVLTQVYGTFILAMMGKELVVLDQHTAHERIRYDAFRKGLADGNVSTLPYIFPQTVRLSPLEVQNIEQRIGELSHLGFDVDVQGPESIKVSGIPTLLEGEDPADLLQELSESSHQFEWPLVRSDRMDETLMTLSCHTSVRANHVLGKEDLMRIIRSLLATEFPFSCPHGRPTILSFSQELFEKWFQRT